ncbi:hypothetical protein OLMES_1795 [Oleiphilus messinensis]|uniref:Uncharacterized protein n=2 Tax=Oleiphilus messinensis TaxID=141451 RepID=A0A1Y0I6Q2_9GAMM|nr:hypothetical protein OLMES_1795 [Oleiphilus messinensis]
MGSAAPSKSTMVIGFLMFAGLAMVSVFFLVSEFNLLITSLNEQVSHLVFEKFVLVGFGGFIAMSAFAVATGAHVLGSPLQDYGQAIALKVAFAGLLLMIVGRIVGGYVIDGVLISNGYLECQELLDVGPRHRRETWALTEEVCEQIKLEDS